MSLADSSLISREFVAPVSALFCSAKKSSSYAAPNAHPAAVFLCTASWYKQAATVSGCSQSSAGVCMCNRAAVTAADAAVDVNSAAATRRTAASSLSVAVRHAAAATILAALRGFAVDGDVDVDVGVDFA